MVNTRVWVCQWVWSVLADLLATLTSIGMIKGIHIIFITIIYDVKKMHVIVT